MGQPRALGAERGPNGTAGWRRQWARWQDPGRAMPPAGQVPEVEAFESKGYRAYISNPWVCSHWWWYWEYRSFFPPSCAYGYLQQPTWLLVFFPYLFHKDGVFWLAINYPPVDETSEKCFVWTRHVSQGCLHLSFLFPSPQGQGGPGNTERAIPIQSDHQGKSKSKNRCGVTSRGVTSIIRSCKWWHIRVEKFLNLSNLWFGPERADSLIYHQDGILCPQIIARNLDVPLEK